MAWGGWRHTSFWEAFEGSVDGVLQVKNKTKQKPTTTTPQPTQTWYKVGIRPLAPSMEWHGEWLSILQPDVPLWCHCSSGLTRQMVGWHSLIRTCAVQVALGQRITGHRELLCKLWFCTAPGNTPSHRSCLFSTLLIMPWSWLAVRLAIVVFDVIHLWFQWC